jgi:hypothetical protein
MIVRKLFFEDPDIFIFLRDRVFLSACQGAKLFFNVSCEGTYNWDCGMELFEIFPSNVRTF